MRAEVFSRTVAVFAILLGSSDDGIVVGVPEISRFYGIVIGMFFSEHGVPHFHASYGEHEVTVEIESGRIHGEFPARSVRLVLEWRALHRRELLDNWVLAREGRPLNRIAPLE